jgi:hypothetical protein
LRFETHRPTLEKEKMSPHRHNFPISFYRTTCRQRNTDLFLGIMEANND